MDSCSYYITLICSYVVVSCLIFFFKQKTAYEMRISDWSSDVCSSDHRIIQAADSGVFLKRVHELLLGEDGFYDEIFRALDVPYEAVQWRKDVRPVDQEAYRREQQMAVQRMNTLYRLRGRLQADLHPTPWHRPTIHPPTEKPRL